LLEAGKSSEFCWLRLRDSDFMQIQIEESLENYKIIKIIEFDSEKKMMSVVVRDQATGKTYSFCKGADTAIA
jgi:magnesium-transporting ATPase (P-type)